MNQNAESDGDVGIVLSDPENPRLHHQTRFLTLIRRRKAIDASCPEKIIDGDAETKWSAQTCVKLWLIIAADEVEHVKIVREGNGERGMLSRRYREIFNGRGKPPQIVELYQGDSKKLGRDSRFVGSGAMGRSNEKHVVTNSHSHVVYECQHLVEFCHLVLFFAIIFYCASRRGTTRATDSICLDFICPEGADLESSAKINLQKYG